MSEISKAGEGMLPMDVARVPVPPAPAENKDEELIGTALPYPDVVASGAIAEAITVAPREFVRAVMHGIVTADAPHASRHLAFEEASRQGIPINTRFARNLLRIYEKRSELPGLRPMSSETLETIMRIRKPR